jgi:hypothetical protein
LARLPQFKQASPQPSCHEIRAAGDAAAKSPRRAVHGLAVLALDRMIEADEPLIQAVIAAELTRFAPPQ